MARRAIETGPNPDDVYLKFQYHYLAESLSGDTLLESESDLEDELEDIVV